MSRVAVAPGVLHWAASRAGFTLDSLRNKFPRLSEWADGQSHPTLRQLENLARATSTPLGYFFLPAPPEERLPIPHFRTQDDEEPKRPSADLMESVQSMERRQAWLREFLLEEGAEPVPVVRSAQPDESPAVVADRLRQVLGLAADWAAEKPTWTEALRALREAMERAGILVVVNGIVGNNTHRKLNPREFRGFVLVDALVPLVFVNGSDGKAAQMFTLGHELAHVAFGSSAAFDLREMQPANDPTELACNRLAAEFLVPEGELRQLWPSLRREPAPFQALARRFKVSALVAARRALDLGLIQRAAFLKFYREYEQDERRLTARRPVGGDFYLNQNLRVGKRFAHAVIRATQEGRLLFSEAYRLTGLHGKAFERFADSVEIEATR